MAYQDDRRAAFATWKRRKYARAMLEAASGNDLLKAWIQIVFNDAFKLGVRAKARQALKTRRNH